MKIVSFLGGLGNQMFQYSFYKFLGHYFQDVKADLSGFTDYSLHNGYELDRIFNIKMEEPSLLERKLYNHTNREWLVRKLRRIYRLKNAYYEEQKPFEFDDSITKDNSSLRYWGYWQNHKYTEPIQDILRNDFRFVKPLAGKNLNISYELENQNSIGIHIRRGDYVSHPLFENIGSIEYYANAIHYLKSTVTDAQFYIFSNDIDWCKRNISEKNSTFVNWNLGIDSYLDMQLMSLCKHNIISNSSFSWWAAWLNENPGKIVISPSKWVNDPNINYGRGIIPQNWITV